jgi:3-deoxy-D-manno-octulosonate 8-phosphate phosphatase (KDO 8-P phosphatase)
MDRRERVRRIRMLVMDVDGVLTDGRIFIGASGEVFKAFNSQDGLGLAAAGKAGLKTAIITGRQSEIVAKRAAELSISIVRQGCSDKAAALEEIAQECKIPLAEIAYIGDDLNDLPAVHRAGLACAVANAALEVKDVAHYVTVKAGGHGAVREVIELILKAQNKWENIVNDYQQSQSEAGQ